MDSYSFQFERMSNVDLHPLSLPVSRLSPAKSSSSIAEQFAHHRHGKGDSAYSSFSGGSTAQDYPSPFLPDDLQSNSFGHYADFKYVKAVYHPARALQTDTRTMDQLCRSVEAISQQYRNNTNIKANHDNNNPSDPVHSNNNAISKQEVPQAQSPCPSILRPPPIPARMDSFITTKNLENTRVHRHSAEIQPQQPQQQPRPHSQLQSQAYGLNAPRPVRVLSDTGDLGPYSEPVYSVWRGSQQQLPQVQPSNYHTRFASNPEYLFITDNKALADQRNSTIVSRRTPSQGKSQLQEHRNPSGHSEGNGDHHSKYNGSDNQSESQRKRAYSVNDWLGSDTQRLSSPWTTGVINSSIQHKGQFYFVTGVCRAQSASSCGSDAGSKRPPLPETYQLREKERCHSTLEGLFRPLQQSSRSSSGTIQDEVFTSLSQDQDLSAWNQDQENRRLSSNSIQSTQSFDTLEEINSRNHEMGRHTSSNPVFYCGPDRNHPPQSASQTEQLPSHVSNEQVYQHKKVDQAKKGTRQPLGDIGSEKINKETTPLLYHLTGASRAALQPKKKSNSSIQGKEINLRTGHDRSAVDEERPLKTEADKNSGAEISACNTLDDSFKKYYKEKLKDAQSKVLRATSFKRRDLQLSWPHRIRPKPEMKPPVLHAFSSSQDSETSTETLTPSLTSEETETGSIKEDVKEGKEMNEEPKDVNWCSVTVAQPQAIRMRGKKRLTPEQKKMCYSEPEKLNHLGGAPFHSSCRSFGNESENVFAAEGEDQRCAQQGEPGLVAARRKLFETRDQAFSVPAAAKFSLKHLQHKALVEYMERKTGHKLPEPQEPGPLVPHASRHRHSLGEKPFDWGSRPLSGSQDGKNSKKKLHRPHSAGRILDSSTSSVRYLQFFSAQSCSGQHALQANQPRWSKGPSQGKSASVESLLDQIEPCFLRNRSASTPHTLENLEACDNEEAFLAVKPVEPTSPQKNSTEDSLKKAVAEGRQRARAAAQRGKSMEELGTSKITRLPPISKSSEQLDTLGSLTGPVGFNGEKRNVSAFPDARQAQGQERVTRPGYGTQQSAEPESVRVTQGQTPNQTQRRSSLKNHSDPEEEPSAVMRNSSRSTSPTSPSSCRVRGLSGPHGPVSNTPTSSRPPSESNPPSPRGLESSECESKSTSPSPTQTRPPIESRSISRPKTSPSMARSEEEPRDDWHHEVSLSCGVTTDPWLWSPPPEESSPTSDSVFDDGATPATAGTPPEKASASPSTSVCDGDAGEQLEDEENSSSGDEEADVRRETEERGTPGGETEGAQEPAGRPQWEELVEAVVEADPSLSRVMYPLANRKTALMLMEQLLSEDTLLMEEHYKKKQELQGAPESVENAKASDQAPLPIPDPPAPELPNLRSKADIAETKRLLVSHIEEHLRSLEEMRVPLQAEIERHAAHGAALELLVREHCLPVELERYSLFIGDLERVVNLLLCLSARLARVQNALSTVDQHTDAEEKQSLDSRHRLLCKQREDAKDLKVNLDRRENVVSTFLSRQLSAEQLQDYRRFVQTKASLLIRQKDLEEKQRLGEEQLEALSSSLNL